MTTPYYEINENQLDQDIRQLMNALCRFWGENSVAACSVKTNSLPWLLTHFKSAGFWAEVVSAEEYDLVSRLGFADNHVIYNGPMKDRAVFEKVLRGGGLVNLDSSEELEWLEELAGQQNFKEGDQQGKARGAQQDVKRAGNQGEGPAGEQNGTEIAKGSDETRWRIGLRINVNYAQLVPEEVPADAEGSRFGYSEESGSLQEALQRLKALPGVQITGLHLHSSTKSRSVAAYEAVADYAGQLARRYQLQDITYIDMGGGYYGGVPGKPDFDDYVPAIAGRLERYFDKKKVTLVMEPGVSMVSASFTFVTSVRDVKCIGDHVYVVTDGSRVNLNPQVTRRWYPHHFVYRTKSARRTISSQMICGATCMEYDRLFEVTDEKELQPGDLVVYDLAGGYTVCLTPLFIHYFPAVYVVRKDGSRYTAREAWTNEEFLQKNHWE